MAIRFRRGPGHWTVVAVCFLAMLVGCGDDDDDKGTDPPVCDFDISVFTGFDETDETGTLIADDPGDWVDAAQDGLALQASAAPNPFDPSRTSLRITLDVSRPVEVSVKIVDQDCNVSAVLTDSEPFDAGRLSIEWGGERSDGVDLPDGLYRCFVEVTDGTATVSTHGDIMLSR